MALALVIFLPNVLWLVQHDFISYKFLQSIHARDVRIGRADGFLLDQFRICINLFATPLWIAGLIGFLRSRRYRMIAFMYLVPLALFFFGKGRGYYMAGAYPMLLAMGAVRGERWLSALPRWGRRTTSNRFLCRVSPDRRLHHRFHRSAPGLSGPLRDFALKHNGDLREEFGWDNLVRTVAQIRDSLPPDQQAHLGIATGNYGEYGAIEILGAAYGLPQPIGTTNSEYLRGYPTPQPTTIIVIGNDPATANALFTNCRLAGHNGNSEGLKNEESVRPPRHLCLWPTPPALATDLEKPPGLRLTIPSQENCAPSIGRLCFCPMGGRRWKPTKTSSSLCFQFLFFLVQQHSHAVRGKRAFLPRRRATAHSRLVIPS